MGLLTAVSTASSRPQDDIEGQPKDKHYTFFWQVSLPVNSYLPSLPRHRAFGSYHLLHVGQKLHLQISMITNANSGDSRTCKAYKRLVAFAKRRPISIDYLPGIPRVRLSAATLITYNIM